MKLRLVAALALLAGSGWSQAATTFTVSSWLPPSHLLSRVQADWCKRVELKSSGSMKCNILPKGVVAAPGTFDAVRDGLADVSYTVDGYTPGRCGFTPKSAFPVRGVSAVTTTEAYKRIYPT